MLRGRFITSAYIKNRFKKNDLIVHIKNLENQEQSKPKLVGGKK
jgi:hypothetical protein